MVLRVALALSWFRLHLRQGPHASPHQYGSTEPRRCIPRDGDFSLVRAAHVAELDVVSFIAYLGRLGIAAIRLTAAETNADLDTLEHWLQSSSSTPVR
jgi:hypothetical protein